MWIVTSACFCRTTAYIAECQECQGCQGRQERSALFPLRLLPKRGDCRITAQRLSISRRDVSSRVSECACRARILKTTNLFLSLSTHRLTRSA